MKRSALPLPRYVLRKPIKSGGYAYYFNAPIWARKAGCPVRNEPLGTDYGLAVQRAETVLLPAFDSWRCGGKPDIRGIAAAPGTLDWVFAEYRAGALLDGVLPLVIDGVLDGIGREARDRMVQQLVGVDDVQIVVVSEDPEVLQALAYAGASLVRWPESASEASARSGA